MNLEYNQNNTAPTTPRISDFKVKKCHTEFTEASLGASEEMVGLFIFSVILCLILFGSLTAVTTMRADQPPPTTFPYVQLIVSILISGAVMYLYIFSNAKQKATEQRILQYGIETTGRITFLSSYKGHPSSLKYIYKDSTGREYKGEQALRKHVVPSSADREGKLYPVYYLPENPSKSILDYTNFVKEYVESEEKIDRLRMHGAEQSFARPNLTPFVFKEKYRSVIAPYYPSFTVYLLVFILMFLFAAYMVYIDRGNFPRNLGLFAWIFPSLVIAVLIDFTYNRVLEASRFRDLSTLYTEGVRTDGELLAYGTDAINSESSLDRQQYPGLRVKYTFRLSSEDFYTVSVNMPIAKVPPALNINTNYPVYYMPDDPRNSTIDIFGFTERQLS